MRIEVVGVVISHPLSNPLSVKKGLRVKNEIIIRLESLNTDLRILVFSAVK